jgi:hypothetical protein
VFSKKENYEPVIAPIATAGKATVKLPDPIGYRIPVANIKSTATVKVPSTVSLVASGGYGSV